MHKFIENHVTNKSHRFNIITQENDLETEMNEWCIENIGHVLVNIVVDDKNISSAGKHWASDDCIFYFERKEDATLFYIRFHDKVAKIT